MGYKSLLDINPEQTLNPETETALPDSLNLSL